MIPAVCIGAAAYIVLACGLGRGIGSMIRAADEAMDDDVNWIEELPPVPAPLPHPMDDAGWDSWVSVWPADTPLAVMEQAVFDRTFEQMPLVADDLRRSA